MKMSQFHNNIINSIRRVLRPKKGVIINHNSHYINELKKLFRCDIINYIDFTPEKVEKYDYVILSGGPIDISEVTDIVAEKKWLTETNKPILGICLGLQILCIAFDKTLEYKKFEENRKIIDKMSFEGVEYDMFYNHSYHFDKIPEGFSGEVKDGILIYMKHREKSIIAFQGHPEMMDKKQGRKIRNYFINCIVLHLTSH